MPRGYRCRSYLIDLHCGSCLIDRIYPIDSIAFNSVWPKVHTVIFMVIFTLVDTLAFDETKSKLDSQKQHSKHKVHFESKVLKL